MPTNQYGVTEFDQDPETAAELIKLRRQQQVADAMLGKSQQPLQGQMVDGVYVAPSITQGLAQLFNAYNAGQANKGVEAGYKGLAERQKQATIDALANYKRGTIGTPEMPMGPPTEEGAMGVQPAMTPTPEQRRQAIIEAATSANPRLSKMGQLDFQLDAKKEERAQAAQDKLDVIREQVRLGQISKQEADARAADLRRELQANQFSQQKSMAQMVAGLRQPRDEGAPVAVKRLDGKGVELVSRKDSYGREPAAGGKGTAMTPTAQKELIQTDEEIQGGAAALTSLGQARAINDQAMGFKGAGAVSSLGTLLPESIRPAAVDATENLDNILTAGTLPQLKAIFGGMPTEGERKVLLEIQGSSSKSPAVRKAIFDRAEAAVKNRIEFAKGKAKSLRDGTYFSDEGTPASSGSSVDALLEKYK